MPHYRIAANGRQYFCDAVSIAAALTHFHTNVEGADARSIIEIGGLTNAQTGQTFDVTVHHPKTRNTRKATRR